MFGLVRHLNAVMNSPESRSAHNLVLPEYMSFMAGLTTDADLYQAGMTSHASVNVMLALEDTFDVEFPDELLKRSVFESVASISSALAQLETQAA